jgi:hypothetical protein
MIIEGAIFTAWWFTTFNLKVRFKCIIVTHPGYFVNSPVLIIPKLFCNILLVDRYYKAYVAVRIEGRNRDSDPESNPSSGPPGGGLESRPVGPQAATPVQQRYPHGQRAAVYYSLQCSYTENKHPQECFC